MSSDKFNPNGMPPMGPMGPMDPMMGGMPGMPPMPGMPQMPMNPMMGGMMAPNMPMDHNMMGGMPGFPGEEPRPDVDLGAERIILPRGMRSPHSKKILITGLPGSGKTTLAEKLANDLSNFGKRVAWFNGDDVRQMFNDNDFTERGRVRQAWRMRAAADDSLQMGADIAIADFVSPTEELRNAYSADIVIWMNTPDIPRRYEDTAQMWQDPVKIDFMVTTRDVDHWVPAIIQKFNLAGLEKPQECQGGVCAAQ